jgi:hypothetical protein
MIRSMVKQILLATDFQMGGKSARSCGASRQVSSLGLVTEATLRGGVTADSIVDSATKQGVRSDRDGHAWTARVGVAAIRQRSGSGLATGAVPRTHGQEPEV